MISLGIDVGGTSVKVAGIDGGRTIFTGQSSTYARPDTESLVKAIREAVNGRISGPVEAGGICVPGIMDREKRMITLSVNVPGLMGVVLDELVAKALGAPISRLAISSDAVAAAYDVADSRKLVGRVFALAIGTGVGAAVLDEGVPLAVSGASPGHFGQLDVTLPDEPDVIGPDGGQGSLEGYLGVNALKKRYGVEDLASVLPKLTPADAPIRALARALRVAHAIYRPQHQILLGGLGTRLTHLVPGLKQLVATNLTKVAREGWTLEAGDSDFHAAQGAAKMGTRL